MTSGACVAHEAHLWVACHWMPDQVRHDKLFHFLKTPTPLIQFRLAKISNH